MPKASRPINSVALFLTSFVLVFCLCENIGGGGEKVDHDEGLDNIIDPADYWWEQTIPTPASGEKLIFPLILHRYTQMLHHMSSHHVIKTNL